MKKSVIEITIVITVKRNICKDFSKFDKKALHNFPGECLKYCSAVSCFRPCICRLVCVQDVGWGCSVGMWF